MKKQLLSACVFALSACVQPLEGEDTAVQTETAPLSASTELRSGPAAVAALSAPRQALHAALSAESATPVALVTDTVTDAAVSLSLSWSAGKPTNEDNAREFIAKYQSLLDPNVSPADLVLSVEKTPCGGQQVSFDRQFSGKPIVGSRLTLHFDAGRLVFVTNGVASVPAVVKAIEPKLMPGATPLTKLIGKTPLSQLKRVPVYVPTPDRAGLYEGDLTIWFDGRYRAAIAVGDVATSEELPGLGLADGAGRFTTPAPKFRSGGRSDVPLEVSYRSIGGVKVSGLAGERNPLERALRFLEEHPTLFHTGAARCQFSPSSVSEDPTVPGVFVAKFEQRHAGLPVFGSQVLVRLEGDRVMHVTARAVGLIEVNTTPSISAAVAANTVKSMLVAGTSSAPAWADTINQSLARPPNTELVVFPRFLSRDLQQPQNRLAWKVTQGHFTFLIDATTKQLLWSASTRASADLIRNAQGAGIFDFFSYNVAVVGGVPQPGGVNNADILPGRAGLPLATSLSNYRAMLAGLGWDTGDLAANTNVFVSATCGERAFMDPVLTNSAFFCMGEAARDTVGHEFTHGVAWHAAKLWPTDEPGAIGEAYGDLLGNLLESLTGSDWRVGENSARGTVRNMATDLPNHYSAYVPRPATGCVFPWECDMGGVHTNARILNRAHVMLADGDVGFSGIGREKTLRLAAFVLTRELPSHALMPQVAGLTRDVCDMFVARGVRSVPSGLAFTTADCDAVTSAFRNAGLDPSMTSGWAEPTLGFEGRDVFFPPSPTGVPALTIGRCAVQNIKLEHQFLGTTLFADYDPATLSTPSSTSVADIFATTAFDFTGVPVTAAGPAPMGTPLMTHAVRWTSLYGVRPSYATSVDVGAVCRPVPETRGFSTPVSRGWDVGDLGWGTTTTTLGSSSVAGACLLSPSSQPVLQLLDGAGRQVGSGPGPVVNDPLVVWFAFVPVTFNASASVLSLPPGGSNLSGAVQLSWDLGRTVRAQWVYPFISSGGTCPVR